MDLNKRKRTNKEENTSEEIKHKGQITPNSRTEALIPTDKRTLRIILKTGINRKELNPTVTFWQNQSYKKGA